MPTMSAIAVRDRLAARAEGRQGRGIDVQDIGRDRAVQHHQEHQHAGDAAEYGADHLGRIGVEGDAGDGGAENREPDGTARYIPT